jgi:hypothetical protein
LLRGARGDEVGPVGPELPRQRTALLPEAALIRERHDPLAPVRVRHLPGAVDGSGEPGRERLEALCGVEVGLDATVDSKVVCAACGKELDPREVDVELADRTSAG